MRNLRKRETEDIFQEINVIPLIDISLVLLIIFMITATFIVAGTGLDIRLPKAKTAKVQEQLQFIVFITKDGKIYLGNEEINIKNLTTKLKKKVQTTKKVVVIISADRNIRYEKLVQVLDAVRLSGVENIGLAAELEKIKEGER
jgi:biopolymer transport protein ExbD